MARFRAFLTDSESEAEEATQNAASATQPPAKQADVSMPGHDSETGSGSGSESGPSPKHRKRTGNPKDEKTYRSSRARHSGSPSDDSSEAESEAGSEDDGSPPPNQSQMDHSLIPRAHQLGVDPQRMHVMQASLFRPGDGVEGVPTHHKALALASGLSLSRKHSRDSDDEGLRHGSQPVRGYRG